MKYRYVDSPFGRVLIASDENGLTWLAFARGRQRSTPLADWVEAKRDPLLLETKRQLDAYFAGKSQGFDLPLAPRGTEFQKQVWKKLVAIPFGRTVTYTELARRVGRPKAFRAVGAANGQNPVSVVIPCHRVLGKNGGLTGYGGGLETKQRLLELERCTTEKYSAR